MTSRDGVQPPNSVTADEIRAVLLAVQANDGQCGRSMIARILRGSRNARLLELGLDRCSTYGALSHLTLERIGHIVDEALARHLIEMHDAGWGRGRRREEAHFPVLSLTFRGQCVLAEVAKLEPPGEGGPPASERARALAIRAMVQGAYALEGWKHDRIEVADFVHEEPGDHVVLFAMERHPGGDRLLCLYLWQQRTNRVTEVDTTPVRRVRNLSAWFERQLDYHRRQPARP